MRLVVLQMGVTLDGFVHGAKDYEDWGRPPEDGEVVAWKVASLREAGTHIMGRATYEAMASVWPNTTGVYADVMNEILRWSSRRRGAGHRCRGARIT
jgi:dihydrofolate reductase